MKKKSAKQRLRRILKSNYLIFIVILLFLVIKLFYLTKAHHVIWDEAVYMGMGKYLYSLGRLGFFEIIRPIGLPLVLGLIWKLGLNYVFFSEVVMVLFATGTILLVYLIGKQMMDSRVGLIAAFLLSISSIFFLYSNYILTGIPSTFFILLGIYVYIRKQNLILSGVFCGAGALFRFPQGLVLVSFVISFFVLYFKDKRKIFFKNSLLFVFGFLLIHIPFFIFNYFIYRKETSKIYHALFRPWILGFWHQSNPAESLFVSGFRSFLEYVFYYVTQIFIQNMIIFVFLLAGLFYIFKNKLYKQEKFSIILMSFFVFLAYFTYISNKQERFLIALLPYASLIAAYGFYYSFVHSKKDRIRVGIVIFVLIYLSLIIPKDLKYFNWRVKEEQPIVTDYYRYFVNNEVGGFILTTDPVPVVYVDAQFIPFYFSVDLANRIYDSYHDDSFSVIFSPESFWCAEGDEICKKELKDLFSRIEEENKLVFSEIYGARAYHIYVNKEFR